MADQIHELVVSTGKPLKTIVNELLRRGLALNAAKARKPFVQTTVAMGWNDTLDPTGFNRFADALALEENLFVMERFEASEGLDS